MQADAREMSREVYACTSCGQSRPGEDRRGQGQAVRILPDELGRAWRGRAHPSLSDLVLAAVGACCASRSCGVASAHGRLGGRCLERTRALSQNCKDSLGIGCCFFDARLPLSTDGAGCGLLVKLLVPVRAVP